jgi:hypothetical protein
VCPIAEVVAFVVGPTSLNISWNVEASMRLYEATITLVSEVNPAASVILTSDPSKSYMVAANLLPGTLYAMKVALAATSALNVHYLVCQPRDSAWSGAVTTSVAATKSVVALSATVAGQLTFRVSFRTPSRNAMGGRMLSYDIRVRRIPGQSGANSSYSDSAQVFSTQILPNNLSDILQQQTSVTSFTALVNVPESGIDYEVSSRFSTAFGPSAWSSSIKVTSASSGWLL